MVGVVVVGPGEKRDGKRKEQGVDKRVVKEGKRREKERRRKELEQQKD